MLPFFRPEAIDLIGPLKIQPFGVLLAVGFIVGCTLCQKYARQRGIDPKTYTDLIFWVALGAMVFGHLGHVAYVPEQYFQDSAGNFDIQWIEFLKVWDGLSSFGGYFGCAAMSVWFFRRRGIPPLRGGDIMMIGLMLGIFIGRLGCFVVHDHIGTTVEESHPVFQKTIGFLAVQYPTEEEAIEAGKTAMEEQESAAGIEGPGELRQLFCCRGADSTTTHCPCSDRMYRSAGSYTKHYPSGAIGSVRYDLGLMDSLLGLFVFLVLVWVARKPRREGLILALTPMLYAPVRLVWDSLRNTDLEGSSDVRYFLAMTPAQIGSVVLFGLGLWVLWMSRSRPVWPGPEDTPWAEPAPKKK